MATLLATRTRNRSEVADVAIAADPHRRAVRIAAATGAVKPFMNLAVPVPRTWKRHARSGPCFKVAGLNQNG